MPRRIFLLGPDEWDGTPVPVRAARIRVFLQDPTAPLTPHGLRLALLAAIHAD
jgi:hypothetical protein